MRNAITLFDPSAAPAAEPLVSSQSVAIIIALVIVLVSSAIIALAIRRRAKRGFGETTLHLLGGRLGLSARDRKALCAMARSTQHEDCPAALLLSRSAFLAGLSELGQAGESKQVIAAAERLAIRMGCGSRKPSVQIEQKLARSTPSVRPPGSISQSKGSKTRPHRPDSRAA